MTAGPAFPRGVLKLAAEALEEAQIEPGDDWAAARTVLAAASPAIERAALRQAARHILLLEGISRGWLCPACHGRACNDPARGRAANRLRLLARICGDPYDAVLSAPSLPGDLTERVAALGGGRGFVEFRVDEEAGLVRVSALAWTG